MTAITPIETVTVGAGGAASITFSAIPDTFTDLLIRTSARSDRGFVDDIMYIQFNGQSATTNYSARALRGGGTYVESYSNLPQSVGAFAGANATASTFGNGSIYIPNYRSSAAKSWSADQVNESNASSVISEIVAGLWNQTAAITSVTLTKIGNNFVQGSTFYLYGILAGSDGIVGVS